MKKEMISLANKFDNLANSLEDLDSAPETLESSRLEVTPVMSAIKEVQDALDAVNEIYIYGDLDKTTLFVNKLIIRCNRLEQAVHKENDESYETIG